VKHAPRRRLCMQRIAAAGMTGLAGLLAGGCGFELRRAPVLRFRGLQLAGFRADSPLAIELRQAVDATPATRVVESAAQAQVVIEAQLDAREKSVVASTAAALVREVQLRARLIYTLRTPGGRVLAPAVELRLTRDMSYDERNALAKEEEEAFLYRAMQSDIVAQVMRRLAALPPLS
jgi:LPS-assembly lipoprotein